MLKDDESAKCTNDADLHNYFARSIAQERKKLEDIKKSLPEFQYIDFRDMNESTIRAVEVKSQNGKIFSLKFHTDHLLSLRDGKTIEVDFMKNYLELLRQSSKIPANVQIIDFGFITCLTREKDVGELSTEELQALVRDNANFSSWFLPKPTFAIEYTVIPIFIRNHYTCFIIKTIKNGSVQLIYCDSRYSINKMEPFLVILR